MKAPPGCFALVLVATAAGCGSSSQSPQGVVVPTPAPASATASAAIAPGGGTITWPVAGGYGGAFIYSANNATASVPVTLSTSTYPVSQLTSQSVPGTPLASFELTLPQSVTFANWQGLLTSITIPPTLSTAGHTFDEYGFDLTANVASGYNPGTVVGTTIDFSVSATSVTLANHTYLLVLTEF